MVGGFGLDYLKSVSRLDKTQSRLGISKELVPGLVNAALSARHGRVAGSTFG